MSTMITLDPNDPDVAEFIRSTHGEAGSDLNYRVAQRMLEQVDPRPPEPMNLGAVVRSGGYLYVRTSTDGVDPFPWYSQDSELGEAEWTQLNGIEILHGGYEA